MDMIAVVIESILRASLELYAAEERVIERLVTKKYKTALRQIS